MSIETIGGMAFNLKFFQCFRTFDSERLSKMFLSFIYEIP